MMEPPSFGIPDFFLISSFRTTFWIYFLFPEDWIWKNPSNLTPKIEAQEGCLSVDLMILYTFAISQDTFFAD